MEKSTWKRFILYIHNIITSDQTKAHHKITFQPISPRHHFTKIMINQCSPTITINGYYTYLVLYVTEQHDGLTLDLPHHSPERLKSRLQWSLGCYKAVDTLVALQQQGEGERGRGGVCVGGGRERERWVWDEGERERGRGVIECVWVGVSEYILRI